MNRNHRRKLRSNSFQVEALDDRTLLSAAAVQTMAAPPPAASPTRGADVAHLENEIQKLEHQFITKDRTLKTQVVGRTSGLESRLKATITREQALAAKSNAAAQVKLEKADMSLTVLSNRLASSLTSGVIGLNTAFQNQVSSLVNRAVVIDPQLSLTASALTSSSQAAGSQLVSNFSNELSAVATAFQLGSHARSGAVGATPTTVSVSGSSSTTSPSTSTTTASHATTTAATTSASTAATTSTGSTTIGIVTSDTQVFNNDFTQAFSAFNSAITGIASTLQTDFTNVPTQITTTINPSTVGIAQTTTFNNAFTQAFSSLTSATNGITSSLGIGTSINGRAGVVTTSTPTTEIGVTTPTSSVTTTIPINITTTASGGSLTSTATGTGGITVSGNGASLI